MDFDKDGNKDLLAGENSGAIWFFRNTGTDANPELARGVRVESNGKAITSKKDKRTMIKELQSNTMVSANHPLAGKEAKIEFTDWNGDGSTDMLVGNYEGRLLVYYNTSEEGPPCFSAPGVITPQSGSFPRRPSPHVADWDGDGKDDLLVGDEFGKIYFYSNCGTRAKPSFESGAPLEAKGKQIVKGKRSRIAVIDWNNDGRLDLVLGDHTGNVWLYLQAGNDKE